MNNKTFAHFPAIRGLIGARLAPQASQHLAASMSSLANGAGLPALPAMPNRAIGMPIYESGSSGTPLAPLPPITAPDTGTFVRWPQVGSGGRQLIPRDIFQQRGYLDLYKPGVPWTLYVAGCDGLRALSNLCKMPLFKVSSCQGGRLQERLKELGRDRYGAISSANGVNFTGWSSWSAAMLSAKLGPLPGSPVSLTKRGVSVYLPVTMRPEDFESQYDREVHHGSLSTWIHTAHGQRLCARYGLDAKMFDRFTEYSFDTGSCVSEAKEIVIFRLDQDVDRLIAIAETIILRHLGLVR